MSRKCESEGCNRIPSFRFHPAGPRGSQEAKGKVRFCAKHKQKDMQDYHKETRGCRFAAPGKEGPPCNRTSSFGLKGGKRTRCARHKQEGEGVAGSAFLFRRYLEDYFYVDTVSQL